MVQKATMSYSKDCAGKSTQIPTFLLPKVAQLRRFTLRGHQGLLKIRRLSTWGSIWRQQIQELLERSLRSWSLEVRPVQLGRTPLGQR